MNDKEKIVFSKQLRLLRKKEKLSQDKLSKALGISQSQLSNYELGKELPKGSALMKLSQFFNISIDSFFGDYNPKKKEVSEFVFAERLKALRSNKNIGQDELSAKIGVSRAQLSYYETSKCVPSMGKLIAIADELNVSLDYLTGRTDDFKLFHVNLIPGIGKEKLQRKGD